MKYLKLLLVSCAILFSTVDGNSQKKKEKKKDENPIASALKSFKFRGVGPAFMSGRIADIAIDETNENVWYVAVGSGGVWKTENSGTTYKPIFDNESTYSTGCVTIDPNDPSIIWLGTGENVGGRHVAYGDGVLYDSSGNNWNVRNEQSALHTSHHIEDDRTANTALYFDGASVIGPIGNEASIGTDEEGDDYAVNAAYTGDNFGVSVTVGAVESDSTSTQIDHYKDLYTAINAYYAPEDFPASISIGYEIGDDGSELSTNDELTSVFLGVSFDEVGPGSAGFAVGTKTPTAEDADEQYMYEAYYSYAVNDGMTITPLVFIKEAAEKNTDDETGVMVKTSFSF